MFCKAQMTHGKPALFIDLGTNGEIALITGEAITATATAAGPAFEAGNISCGVGSIPGAIYKVKYNPGCNQFEWEMLSNHVFTSTAHKKSPGIRPEAPAPSGLCGSGVLDVVAELVKHGLVDESGLITTECASGSGILISEPDIRFTQKDVRELQLAKAAIRAGVEILLADAGLNHADLGTVFLAGGFGHHMNIESALVIGLLPQEIADYGIPVKALGNASLEGCIRFLCEPDALAEIETIIKQAKEVNLSTHKDFNELFMEYMYLGN